VSKAWGIRDHVGKGWVLPWRLRSGRAARSVRHQRHDYNFLFHNLGNRFEEVAFEAESLWQKMADSSAEWGRLPRLQQRRLSDIAYVALNNQTFPLYRNTARAICRGHAVERHARTQLPHVRLRRRALRFRQRWMEGSVCQPRSCAIAPAERTKIDEYNTVFRNPGPSGKWTSLTEEAGLTASPPAPSRLRLRRSVRRWARGCRGNCIGRNAEIWMNRTQKSGHWLDIALRGTKSNRDGLARVSSW